ncbi:MAG TPA: outer membrane lipoprotein-sorting protein [Phycisphaerae bacterium]|nr:outer membrane lipoprotein-sorting protein [Phycisphaerae bacterium]
MRRTHVIFAAFLLAAGTFAPAARAADAKQLTAMDVVRNANRVAYYQGADGRTDVKMTITDEQGRTRTREMTILRRDEPDPEAPKTDDPKKKDEHCGEQRFYVYFHRPADVNKMSFLVWKHLDKDDDRWLYLPALDLVKRISSADKRTSFVGSHFFYEDVSGRSIHDDTHELVKTTDTYYVLKSTPKDPKTVEFGHFVSWIHKATFLVVQQEYYDRKGEKYRQYKALAMKTIQDFPTVTQAQMTDLRTKGNTVLEYSNIKYDAGLPEDIFTERYLRRAPQAYLK